MFHEYYLQKIELNFETKCVSSFRLNHQWIINMQIETCKIEMHTNVKTLNEITRSIWKKKHLKTNSVSPSELEIHGNS